MTRLLVSVKNASEAQEAHAAGARAIDVKEPARGPLGAADLPVVDEIARWLPSGVLLSAADGELIEREKAESGPPVPRAWPARLRYAKIGLAGAAGLAGWRETWRLWSEKLPGSTLPVAVVYADWQSNAAPRPEEIIDLAAGWGWPAVLIDTFDKSRGSLLDHLSDSTLARLSERVRQGSLGLVFGGSLASDLLHRVLPLEPDLIAVRSAVCRRSRQGPIEGQLVHQMLLAAEGREGAGAIQVGGWFSKVD